MFKLSADAACKTSRPEAMPDTAKAISERYLAAWARLQARKPDEVSAAEWRQAIDDAGKFLEGEMAKKAVDNGWTARDLFDPPDRGVPGGLLWFTRGAPVASLGSWHASIGEGSSFSIGQPGTRGKIRERPIL